MYKYLRLGWGLVRGGGKKAFFFFSFLQNPPPFGMNFFLLFGWAICKAKNGFGGSQLARPYGIVSQYVVENAQKRGSFFFIFILSLVEGGVVWCEAKSKTINDPHAGFPPQGWAARKLKKFKKVFSPFLSFPALNYVLIPVITPKICIQMYSMNQTPEKIKKLPSSYWFVIVFLIGAPCTPLQAPKKV